MRLRPPHRILASITLSLLSSPAAGVDASRLWLPKSLDRYQAQLLQAAELALAEEHCETLLEGTIDREQSTVESPVYRILCRSLSGTSFNLMVDLEQGQILGDRPAQPPKLKYATAEVEDLADPATVSQPTDFAWPACEAALLQSTALMSSLKWLQPWPLEAASADSGTTTYVTDFNAVDAHRKTLRFQARCSVSADAGAEVNLRRRP